MLGGPGPAAAKNQTEVFRSLGFYMKALPALSDRSYAIVLNTNLGGANAVQTAVLKASLEWVLAKHGSVGVVYILGHHPSVMGVGVDLVDEKYRPLVRGTMCGHNHVAKSTTATLFTNVGALTYCGNGNSYLVAVVNETHPEIHINVRHGGVDGKHVYLGRTGQVTNVTQWS